MKFTMCLTMHILLWKRCSIFNVKTSESTIFAACHKKQKKYFFTYIELRDFSTTGIVISLWSAVLMLALTWRPGKTLKPLSRQEWVEQNFKFLDICFSSLYYRGGRTSTPSYIRYFYTFYKKTYMRTSKQKQSDVEEKISKKMHFFTKGDSIFNCTVEQKFSETTEKYRKFSCYVLQ